MVEEVWGQREIVEAFMRDWTQARCGQTQDVPRFEALDEVNPLLLLELTIVVHRLQLVSLSGWWGSCLDVISEGSTLATEATLPLI